MNPQVPCGTADFKFHALCPSRYADVPFVIKIEGCRPVPFVNARQRPSVWLSVWLSKSPFTLETRR